MELFTSRTCIADLDWAPSSFLCSSDDILLLDILLCMNGVERPDSTG